MIIAIPVNSNVKPEVNSTLGRAPYFYIYNTENKEFEIMENEAAALSGGAGIKAAQILVDRNVNVLLTPQSGENALQVLEKADIIIYKTEGTDVSENLIKFDLNKLNKLNEGHAGYHSHGRS